MAEPWCYLVACLLVVRAVSTDDVARVHEVLDEFSSKNESLHYFTIKSEEYALKDSVGLEWLSIVTSQKGFRTEKVSPMCLADMETYWKGLSAGEKWAATIYDANGRYSSQLLFGNDFYLGSHSLCNEVDAPAFNVSFRVAKLKLSLPSQIIPQDRNIFLGICHPSSCSSTDSYYMLTTWTASNKNSTSLTVINVRPVPGPYSLLQDRRFQALSGIIIIIVCLVFISTLHEYIHQKKKTPEIEVELRGVNNNKFNKKDEGNDLSVRIKEGSLVEESRKEESKEGPQPTRCNDFLMAFSLLSNGQHILNLNTQTEGIVKCIHGLRVLSLFWVILVHTYLQFFAIAGNKMIREVTERSFMFQTIGNATFSVDTFFFISGLLIAYLYDMNNKREHSLPKLIMEFFKLMFYRFVRLTPVYLMVIGIVQQSMTYIRNNSVFEPTILDHYSCEKYWWRNILYINNFYPKVEMCMLWSWYLAADTQFFTLGAIILILAKRKLKMAMGIMCSVLVCACCTTAFVAYSNQYHARVSEPFGLFDELYDKPWTRVGPYIVGMASGWFIKKNKTDLKISMPLAVLGWTLSLGCLGSIVFGLRSGLDVTLSTVYVSLGHTAWGLGLAWIAVTCQAGQGGIINRFLSNPLMYPLSRLTFCAYLVHPVIMVLTSYVMDGPFHIHNGLMVIVFLGNTVASFLLAFLLSLGVEMPVNRLLKLAMK